MFIKSSTILTQDGEPALLQRRTLLQAGLGAACLAVLPSVVQAAPAAARGRELNLYNAHTGERFKGEFWHNGRYLPDAFAEIKALMRDHRNGQQYPIDPRLMDILYVLQEKTENKNAFEIFSGYRSPATNERLRRVTNGVARESLHMQGQAVDLRLPGTRLADLRKSAISLKAGGVGYYPKSSFVHIDTGRVRHW